MKYIDESGNTVSDPDLTKGKIVSEKQEITAHHPAVAEVSHMENMEGTEGRGVNGGYLQRKVIDTPAQDTWDEYDTVATYHAYTADEQAAYDAGVNAGARIVAAEKAGATMQEAIDFLLLGQSS